MVDVGKRDTPMPYSMFAIGVMLLIGLFIYGNVSDDANTTNTLVWVSLFFIGASIIFMLRKRVIAIAMGFMLLLTIYYVSGLAMGWLNMDVVYSYGVATFLVLSVFVMWVGIDVKLNYGDFAKVILFTIISYVINASGWLGSVNEIVATYMAGGLPI